VGFPGGGLLTHGINDPPCTTKLAYQGFRLTKRPCERPPCRDAAARYPPRPAARRPRPGRGRPAGDTMKMTADATLTPPPLSWRRRPPNAAQILPSSMLRSPEPKHRSKRASSLSWPPARTVPRRHSSPSSPPSAAARSGWLAGSASASPNRSYRRQSPSRQSPSRQSPSRQSPSRSRCPPRPRAAGLRGGPWISAVGRAARSAELSPACSTSHSEVPETSSCGIEPLIR
jgi:hypothetical protein